MFKKKTNKMTTKKGKKSPPAGVESRLRPLMCELNALSIVPQQLLLNIDTKLIIFKNF